MFDSGLDRVLREAIDRRTRGTDLEIVGTAQRAELAEVAAARAADAVIVGLHADEIPAIGREILDRSHRCVVVGVATEHTGVVLQPTPSAQAGVYLYDVALGRLLELIRTAGRP